MIETTWPRNDGLLAMLRCSAYVLAVLSVPFVLNAPILAQTTPQPVLTQHNDIRRSGDYLSETALSPQTVSEKTFGKLWTMPVIGRIYAQPLYVPNVAIGGGTHNVVYVATAANYLYAFDADTPGPAYWSAYLGKPVKSIEYDTSDFTYRAIEPVLGIISTPVIDTATNLLYCVANTEADGIHYFTLHALNLSTGADATGQGVVISGTTPGTGVTSVGGVLTFNAFYELQRPALLLQKNVLYIGFGSHHDDNPSLGWMFAYSAINFTQLGVYCSAPNSTGLASFWNSGQGPAADDNGFIYASTGNGPFDVNTGGQDYGQSVIKLQLANGKLSLVDYFTPWDYAGEDAVDKDLGVGGPMLLPGYQLAIQGGKDGHLYLMNMDNLGQFNPTGDDQIVEDFQAGNRHIHGSPVFWHSNAGDYIYIWSEIDHLKQYKINDGLLETTPFSESPMPDPPGMPGGMLSVSAAGPKVGSGIVWACVPYNAPGQIALVTGVLRAFDADNVSNLLFDSEVNPTRDKLGYFAKFVAPTVANDKVYVASDSQAVVVYGLLK
jgi:hypothetical protein